MGRRNSWSGLEGETRSFLSQKNIVERPSTASLSNTWQTKGKPCANGGRRYMPSSKSFYDRYQELCIQYRLIPISKILKHLSHKVLDLPADRLKLEEWKPLLETLNTDQDLHKIFIHSHYLGRVVRCADTAQKAAYVKKCPVIFTQYSLCRLINSLGTCLSINQSLVYLELEGIPLHAEYLSQLFEGINKSKSLKCLLFNKCPIGDEGTRTICRAVNLLPNVIMLGIIACGLTSKGVGHIASLIKRQKIHRFMETWQQSLRYQIPNLDSMWGLRHICLNSNPLIGDEGIKVIIEALEDDLWFKAIDMQKCGIEVAGAIEVINFLNYNNVISQIDISGNKGVHPYLLQHIMLILQKKNQHNKSERYELKNVSSARQQPIAYQYSMDKTPRPSSFQKKSTKKHPLNVK